MQKAYTDRGLHIEDLNGEIVSVLPGQLVEVVHVYFDTLLDEYIAVIRSADCIGMSVPLEFLRMTEYVQ